VRNDRLYAIHYDLLYSNRDVRCEVDFLERIFREYAPFPVRRVIDLGCGSGGHSVELARRGYEVLGVDLSEEMIARAREKASGLTNASFMVADVRKLDFREEFDAAIAIYGVISYFTSDDELLDFLRSVRRSLRGGGCFVFDTWSALGVLEKRAYFEMPSTHFRKSGPMLAIKEEVWRIDALNQVSTAEISWSLMDMGSGSVDTMTHELELRLFTPRELRHFLSDAGFDMVAMFEDYSGKPVTEDSPELTVVARARPSGQPGGYL